MSDSFFLVPGGGGKGQSNSVRGYLSVSCLFHYEKGNMDGSGEGRRGADVGRDSLEGFERFQGLGDNNKSCQGA